VCDDAVVLQTVLLPYGFSAGGNTRIPIRTDAGLARERAIYIYIYIERESPGRIEQEQDRSRHVIRLSYDWITETLTASAAVPVCTCDSILQRNPDLRS